MALLIGAAASPIAAAPANTLTACEQRRGFELLFDGTRESFASHFVEYLRNDSSTDTPLAASWKAEAADSAMHSGPAQPNLRSRERFADFDLRAEFRNDGAAGFFYRGTLAEAELWMTGPEYTLEDNTSLGNRKIWAGSVYDMFPSEDGHYHTFATGLWNQARIVAIGDSVEHWLNGARVAAYRFHSPAWWSAYDRSKWTGFPSYGMKVPGRRDSGPIYDGYLGIQANWGGKWSLRSLRVSRHPAFYDESVSCPDLPAAAAKPRASAFPPFTATVRRTGSGLILTAGSRILSARLVSLDGRTAIAARPFGSAEETVFTGSIPRGVYRLELRTAAGISYRKLSLL